MVKKEIPEEMLKVMLDGIWLDEQQLTFPVTNLNFKTMLKDSYSTLTNLPSEIEAIDAAT